MLDLIRLFVAVVADLFWSRSALEAEILVLRQQIVVLRRGKPTRLQFVGSDRWLLGWVCCLFPNACDALAIVRPETVVRWHRAGFRSHWRWKSRRRLGRPAVSGEIRHLIREMSIANPLWGAPRVHGELLKLGIDVGQTSVASREDLRHKGGRPFSAIMRMASPPWTCSWCQPPRSGYCMDC
jgi:hypothetical protein